MHTSCIGQMLERQKDFEDLCLLASWDFSGPSRCRGRPYRNRDSQSDLGNSQCDVHMVQDRR